MLAGDDEGLDDDDSRLVVMVLDVREGEGVVEDEGMKSLLEEKDVVVVCRSVEDAMELEVELGTMSEVEVAEVGEDVAEMLDIELLAMALGSTVADCCTPCRW